MSYLGYRGRGMKGVLILTVLVMALLFGFDIKLPSKEYTSSGSIVDMTVHEGKLYTATDASCVDVFDLETTRLVSQIKVEKIKDFMGDLIHSKVYSIDAMKGRLVLLSQDSEGFRRVHIHVAGKNELLISKKEKLYVAKIGFLDENTILLALLGNQLISYDIKDKKYNWMVSVSQSKFSDFMMNEQKDEVVVADESGDLKILSTKDGALIKTLSGQNLDNVFQVDYKNGIIATAGQDRRVVIYDTMFSSAYYKEAPFLIYSVGLSPSGKRVGFASDENNNVSVFDTVSKKTIGVYGGNKMTLSKILFLNETEFLVSSDDRTINFYHIK
jgi:WD40 repeat protein